MLEIWARDLYDPLKYLLGWWCQNMSNEICIQPYPRWWSTSYLAMSLAFPRASFSQRRRSVPNRPPTPGVPTGVWAPDLPRCGPRWGVPAMELRGTSAWRISGRKCQVWFNYNLQYIQPYPRWWSTSLDMFCWYLAMFLAFLRASFSTQEERATQASSAWSSYRGPSSRSAPLRAPLRGPSHGASRDDSLEDLWKEAELEIHHRRAMAQKGTPCLWRWWLCWLCEFSQSNQLWLNDREYRESFLGSIYAEYCIFFLGLSHFEQMQGRVFESMTSRMGKARDQRDPKDPKDIRRCQGSIPVSRRRTPGKILYRSRVDVGRFCWAGDRSMIAFWCIGVNGPRAIWSVCHPRPLFHWLTCPSIRFLRLA